ncbi:MAG: hypothetical protein ACE1ZA_17080, partial [Pseudomonadales bacterium]
MPHYTLPDPLVLSDGAPVDDAEAWWNRRRPVILALFEQHVYGKAPGKPERLSFDLTSEDRQALGGKATRKEITVYFTEDKTGPRIDLLLYLPNASSNPVPVFVGLNFYGNHSIHPDPGITLSKQWMQNNNDFGVIDNQATEASRGVRA